VATAETDLPRAASTVPSFKYHAFLSYSHRADRRLAPALQSALNRFARPWYRLRWMTIFRDDTDLGISPHLWSSIQDALARSAYFVLLASPAAARSPWVAKEVEYWRANRPVDRLLIALTDGDIEWDAQARDFDWKLTTSLPQNLSGAFTELPFYADLRGLRNAAELSRSNPAFVGEVAKLAATIHGKPLRDMFGEELRQRRFRAAAVTATVLVLTIATVVAIVNAIAANRSARSARSRELAVASRIERAGNPDLGVILADRAVQISPTAEAIASLRDALHGSPLRGILRGDSKALVDVAFSPDGLQAVTGGLDGVARVWDTTTGRLAATLAGHSQGINTVRFSRDGKRILTSGEDGSARLWDVSSGKEVCAIRHQRPVRDAEFSPDSSRIVTAGLDRIARVADGRTCATMVELNGHRDGVARASFSGDGRRILTTGFDDSTFVWDAATASIVATLRHPGANFGILSPDGSRAVTAGLDGAPRLWNAETGNPVAVLGGVERGGSLASFSPDGARVLVAGVQPAARVFEVQTGSPVAEWARPDDLDPRDAGNPGAPSGAFSRDGRQAITWIGSTVRLWDPATGRETALFAGHTEKVQTAAFSPDGTQVISASFDGTARIWQATPARLTGQLNEVGRSFERAAFSADTRSIAIATAEDGVRVWNLSHGTPAHVLRSGMRMFQSVAFSPDGARVVAQTTPYAEILEAGSGKVVATLRSPSVVDAVTTPRFSPDGRRVVAASATHVRIWDADTGQLVQDLQGHKDAVTSAEFNADGTQVVAGSRDGTALVWALASGRILHALTGHTESVSYAAFNRDGSRIVTASGDHSARVWDTASGRVVAVLSGHTRPLSYAVFDSDGRFVATLGDDHTVRVWDATSGQEVEQFSSPSDDVRTMAFIPGQRRVVTLTSRGQLATIRCELCEGPDALRRLAAQRIFRKPSDEEVRRYRLNHDGVE
jgi:WD40 repeat protein